MLWTTLSMLVYIKDNKVVSKYALMYITEEFDLVRHISIDNECCDCIFKCTHNLLCAYELARYNLGSIPLNSMHVIGTRVNFSDMSPCNTSSKLFIQQKIDIILNYFKEVDIVGKVTIKRN